MLRLSIALVGLVAVTGCRDVGSREEPSREAHGRELELARAGEVAAPADRPAVIGPESPSTTKPEPSPSAQPDPPAPTEPEPSAPLATEPATAAEPDSVPEASTAPHELPDTSAYVPGPSEEIPPTVDLPSDASDSTPVTRAAGTLPVGTIIHAALEDSIHSRHDVSGKEVMGKVMENVRGADGLTLIPAGTSVRFTVTQVKPGRGDRAGVLEMRADSITLDGTPRKVDARLEPVPHELRGRGVTGEEAAKVGAGAAGGAVVGRVLGGDTRGAVIGGIVGAAGGAVVASETALRDVVVKARTPVTLVLTAPLVAAR
jgi:hypothetical protein